MIISKEAIGLLSFVIALIATGQYFVFTIRGKIKPHVFTWLVWGLVMGISAAARTADNAGPGAWAAWAVSASCLSIGVLAVFKGEKNITKSDIVAFVGALSAIPVWLVTNNPLMAVLIVTAIDLIGYYPTFRKSFHRPFEEATFNYFISNALHLLSLYANAHTSLTTTITPIAYFLANSCLVILILIRRRQLPLAQAPT